MSKKPTNEELGVRGHPKRTPEQEEMVRELLRQADRDASYMLAYQTACNLNAEAEEGIETIEL